MSNGRGAWPNGGRGGTLKPDGKTPGPYYTVAASGTDPVGATSKPEDMDHRAVWYGVQAIQRALNRRLGDKAKVTGVFDKETSARVRRFQLKRMPDVNAWGGVGMETSMALFQPDIARISEKKSWAHPEIVCGLLKNESGFDPGAIGYLDEQDQGLAQINGPSHPSYSEKQRFSAGKSIGFMVSYLINAYQTFGNLDDAIASYNLGLGGTRTWIKAGRPDQWQPAGSTAPRDVAAYIDRIKTGCAAQ